MNIKRDAVLKRIVSIEQDIRRAREYLESGLHADWHGFRPTFARKFREGRELPPHKDWVRNVFLRKREKALLQAEKLLDRLGVENSN
jgi:hypothetical protein